MTNAKSVLFAWGKIFLGKAPILSIEITRECPLDCPGCYAYGDTHLEGGGKLKDLTDLRGDALVNGVIDLVKRYDPVHVSLVGGEPLVRHREVSRILPVLSKRGVSTMVVTSAVLPIPMDWFGLYRTKVSVSVDGLPEDHDVRRKPATYERILKNIEGRKVDLSLVVTQQMMRRPGYLDEYLAFWSAQPAVNRVILNIYTPQVGEESEERLTPEARQELIRILPELKRKYPVLLMREGVVKAYGEPPRSPRECSFSQMSVNYSADLKTRVEPCVFGGNPDCSQCGCGATALIHWIGNLRWGPLKVSHLVRPAIAIGSAANRLRPGVGGGIRWNPGAQHNGSGASLVQIGRS